MSKFLCDCGKMAQWCYMPGFKSGYDYICDDCIVSDDDIIGCSCNWRCMKNSDNDDFNEIPEGDEGVNWKRVIGKVTLYSNNDGELKEEDGMWQYVDERGRPYPCVEYDYSEDGYEKPTLVEKIENYFYDMKFVIRIKYRKFVKNFNKWVKNHICDDYPYEDEM